MKENILKIYDKNKLVFFTTLFLIFLITNHLFNYSLLKENVSAYENNIILRVKDKLDTLIYDKFMHIDSIKKYLEQNQNIKNRADLEEYLKNIQKVSLFPYLTIGTLDKEFYISEKNFKTFDGYDPTKRLWFQDTILANKTIITKPYVSLRLNLPAISVCTPINIFKQKGVLCGGQPLLLIQEYIKSYENIYSKPLFLFDKDILLASSTGEKKLNSKNEYKTMKIKNTDWLFVLEKDKKLYKESLNKQLIVNIIIFLSLLFFFIYINIFYIRTKNKIEKKLQIQTKFFNEYTRTHTKKAVVFCDEKLDILSLNNITNDILKNKKNHLDIFSLIENSENLSSGEKKKIVQVLKKSISLKESQFITFQTSEDKKYYLMISSVLFDNNKHGFLISIQDISNVQITNETENKTLDTFNPYLEKLLFFIENNLDDENLKIDKLSVVSGYSKFHLQRIFKQYMGATIGEYIKRLRLQKSIFLLKYTNENISIICRICGFTYNQSYTRLFEKTYNITPNNYRNKLLSSLNKSLKFNENEYEFVELEEFSLLYIKYSGEKDKLLKIEENLRINHSSIISKEYSFVSIYTNNINIFDLKPNRVCLPVKDDLDNKTSLPIHKFEKAKWIKIVFDPSKGSLDNFLERVYYSFYLNKCYLQVVPILRFNKETIKNFGEEKEVSEFYIKVE